MPVVLVVDDEFIISSLLADVLTDESYVVVVANNGLEAMRHLERSCPDIVVCDYMMPGLDGVAFLKALRAHPVCKDVPFILMSALPPSRSRRPQIEYSAFIMKPFKLEAVVTLISSFLRPDTT